MANQYTNTSELSSTTMVQAEFTAKGRHSWRKWYVCTICGFSFPEDQVVLIGGAPYCTKYKHYEDAE
jgi:hypothetical protein